MIYKVRSTGPVMVMAINGKLEEMCGFRDVGCTAVAAYTATNASGKKGRTVRSCGKHVLVAVELLSWFKDAPTTKRKTRYKGPSTVAQIRALGITGAVEI